jgi:hypothetical protein
MTTSAIQIGLHPDVIDFSSPEFARFRGLTPRKLQAAHDGNISQLRQAGFDVDGCQVDLGETAIEVVRDAITAKHYDAALIGAGIRLVASNTLLFEAIVNTVHELLPAARLVFNAAAVTSPDDIRRWFPNPAARHDAAVPEPRLPPHRLPDRIPRHEQVRVRSDRVAAAADSPAEFARQYAAFTHWMLKG